MRRTTVSSLPGMLIFCVCFGLLAPGLFGSWIVARAQAEMETSELLTPELARQFVDEVLPEVERLRGLEFLRPVPMTPPASTTSNNTGRVLKHRVPVQAGHVTHRVKVGTAEPRPSLVGLFGCEGAFVGDTGVTQRLVQHSAPQG